MQDGQGILHIAKTGVQIALLMGMQPIFITCLLQVWVNKNAPLLAKLSWKSLVLGSSLTTSLGAWTWHDDVTHLSRFLQLTTIDSKWCFMWWRWLGFTISENDPRRGTSRNFDWFDRLACNSWNRCKTDNNVDTFTYRYHHDVAKSQQEKPGFRSLHASERNILHMTSYTLITWLAVQHFKMRRFKFKPLLDLLQQSEHMKSLTVKLWILKCQSLTQDGRKTRVLHLVAS